MATVDATVHSAIACFPSLFSSRTAVLHHILCVIGNGYCWAQGEAVHDYPETEVAWTPEHERSRNREFLGGLVRDLGAEHPSVVSIAADFEQRTSKYAQIAATAAERSQLREESLAMYPQQVADKIGQAAIYPQSEYALLMNVPADITEDWAAAVAEMRTYATAHGWIFQD